jgi:hypothetical protein
MVRRRLTVGGWVALHLKINGAYNNYHAMHSYLKHLHSFVISLNLRMICYMDKLHDDADEKK